MAAGAFAIDVNEHEKDNFNLRPLDLPDPIPEDQRKLSHDVYEARNILKLLKEQRAFQHDAAAYNEFINRVLQAATVGCVARHVDTRLAAEALEQIRADVVRRKGRTITYRYLSALAGWALAGVAVGLLLVFAERFFPGLTGYGWVIMGSMGGAWISVAVTRRDISFEGTQDFLDFRYEPFIRVLFVGCLTSVLALFLQLKILSLAIGGVDLAAFPDHIGWALVLGVIAGIGEKALSVQVIERARKVLAPASA
ncbi:MAG TPA: hypothetical protein VFN71_16155 [Methylomirabilota bacterium]|nr:hypothetical protein [Methylomirabilota bacterium]